MSTENYGIDPDRPTHNLAVRSAAPDGHVDPAVEFVPDAHQPAAAAAYLRAAKYHETASYGAYLEMGPEKGVARFDELWERYRTAWDAFLGASAWVSEPVEIPYEATTLPGHLIRSGDGRRRTLVMNNGSDGSMVDMWMQGALDAL